MFDMHLGQVGFIFLISACLICLIKTFLIARYIISHNKPYIIAIDRAVNSHLLLLILAFLCLVYAFVTSDFSVALVFNHSHTDKPLLYKITGVWGNHEGSLLLWSIMIAVYEFFGNKYMKKLHMPSLYRARVLFCQNIIAIGMLLLMICTSNPFAAMNNLLPVNGLGLNPILQDIGLAIHPPILYFGYVGFSLVFSFAMAALLEGRIDIVWARWVRPWVAIAWSFLTLGVGLGAWWSYYELGWGGWWAWDPVENASIMPWLSATALMHTIIIYQKLGKLKQLSFLLSILTFTLSFTGTFLVRSGIITSIHEFSSDPTRGLFILILIALISGTALIAHFVRFNKIVEFTKTIIWSREGFMLLGVIFLLLSLAVVFFGTIYPIFVSLLGLGDISIGSKFFNTVFMPIILFIIAIMHIGPLAPFKNSLLRKKAILILKFLPFTTLLSIIEYWYFPNNMIVLITLFITNWSILSTILLFYFKPIVWSNISWHRLGMIFGHVSFALLFLIVVISSFYRQENLFLQKIDQTIQFADYKIKLEKVSLIQKNNYETKVAAFLIQKGDKQFNLYPEIRQYRSGNYSHTTETAIYKDLYGDLHVAIGNNDKLNYYSVRVIHNPLVAILWLSIILLALSGLFAVKGSMKDLFKVRTDI